MRSVSDIFSNSILGKSKISKNRLWNFSKTALGIRGIPRFCVFRDFEDSEISQILKFLAVPVLCRERHAGEEAGREARGRAAV